MIKISAVLHELESFAMNSIQHIERHIQQIEINLLLAQGNDSNF